ncbi:MAG: helix-turn-helix domain-containing protein [Phycisphaerae bacterium]|nr:helix-turn-helix domain-containing protein [Phycisphaerae bacterium]
MKKELVHEKFHYIQLSPLLTYAGISSAAQLLILAMTISCQKTGLWFRNSELAELLNTSERNIQKAIQALESKDLIYNSGNKHKRILIVKYEQLCALITNNLAHSHEQEFVLGVNDCALSYERLCALLYKEELNTNLKEKPKENKRSFYPPSLDDVQKYISEKGLSVEAIRFIEHYSKLGWKDVNGRPVRDWKKKLLTVWSKSNGYRTTIPARQQPIEDFASQESKQGITIRV